MRTFTEKFARIDSCNRSILDWLTLSLVMQKVEKPAEHTAAKRFLNSVRPTGNVPDPLSRAAIGTIQATKATKGIRWLLMKIHFFFWRGRPLMNKSEE